MIEPEIAPIRCLTQGQSIENRTVCPHRRGTLIARTRVTLVLSAATKEPFP